MNRPAARRKVRKRKNPAQNSRVKLSGFLGIMLLAVFLGYLTARFVVGPIIGYDADESPAKLAEEEESTQEQDSDGSSESDASEVDTVSSVPNLSEGYALQFGAFSTEEAAEKLTGILKSKGIETEVITEDDVYKVISPLMDTKEKALNALSSLPDTGVEDVFVTSFE